MQIVLAPEPHCEWKITESRSELREEFEGRKTQGKQKTAGEAKHRPAPAPAKAQRHGHAQNGRHDERQTHHHHKPMQQRRIQRGRFADFQPPASVNAGGQRERA